MGNLTGLLWFNGMDPSEMVQNFSIAADKVSEAGAEIIEADVLTAKRRMQEIIVGGGMNKTKKGGPRVLSGDMLASVEGDVRTNSRGRIQGKIGFSKDTPEHTKWQEHGTARGIPEMLAYVTAQEELVDALQGKYASGDWAAKIFERYL